MGIHGDGYIGVEHKGMVWDIDAQSDTWGTSGEDGVSPVFAYAGFVTVPDNQDRAKDCLSVDGI